MLKSEASYDILTKGKRCPNNAQLVTRCPWMHRIPEIPTAWRRQSWSVGGRPHEEVRPEESRCGGWEWKTVGGVAVFFEEVGIAPHAATGLRRALWSLE